MEKNTVVLAIEEYNALRDLRADVLNKENKQKFVVIRERQFYNGGAWETRGRKYYTESEIALDFEKERERLQEEIDSLLVDKRLLLDGFRGLSRMTWWELLRAGGYLGGQNTLSRSE